MPRPPRLLALLSTLACLTHGCIHDPLLAPGDDWVVAETAHVRLATDYGEARAKQIAAQMEGAYGAFAARVFKCAFGKQLGRVEVVVLSSQRDFELVAPKHSAGFYRDGHGLIQEPVIVQQGLPTAEGLRLFKHELTHRLVAACFPSAPTWLGEGFAELLETASHRDGVWRVGLPPYGFWEREYFQYTEAEGVRVLWLPMADAVPPSELVTLAPSVFYAHDAAAEDAAANYASAWMLVHMLESQADLRAHFDGYLRELVRGGDPLESFTRNFRGVDLDGAFDRYLRGRRYNYLALQPQQQAAPTVRMRKLDRADAQLQWARLWGLGSTAGRARAAQHIEQAARLAPDRGSVLAAQARLAIAEERFADAVELMEKSPVDRTAWRIKAVAALQQKAELPLEELERGLPPPRTGLEFRLLMHAAGHNARLAKAVGYARDALEQNPGCQDCRVVKARALVEQGRVQASRRELERLVSFVERPSGSLLDRIAEVEQRQAEVARLQRKVPYVADRIEQPVSRDGRVVSALGTTQVAEGDRCSVTVRATPNFPDDSMFNCQLRVQCGGTTLYGEHPDSGFTSCQVQAGKPVLAVDPFEGDGDGALRLDVPAGGLEVNEGPARLLIKLDDAEGQALEATRR